MKRNGVNLIPVTVLAQFVLY